MSKGPGVWHLCNHHCLWDGFVKFSLEEWAKLFYCLLFLCRLLQLFPSFMSSSASWNCICLVHCDYAKSDFESGREAYEWCQNGYKLCWKFCLRVVLTLQTFLNWGLLSIASVLRLWLAMHSRPDSLEVLMDWNIEGRTCVGFRISVSGLCPKQF
jgi:hypothetical protein